METKRRVKDIMSQPVETVSPDAPVIDAARLMRASRVGVIPVLEKGRVAGILTDRDIVGRCVAGEGDAKLLQVRSIMTADVVWCHDTFGVEDAAALMAKHGIRRMPVLDRNDRVVGLVSLDDIAMKGRDDRLTGKTLKKIQNETPAGI